LAVKKTVRGKIGALKCVGRMADSITGRRMKDDSITLFLTDDHQIVIEGIMALVAKDPCIQVVGHCNNGLEVMGKIEACRPDVVVLDISLPGMNGLDLCRIIKKRLADTMILMLTMHSNERCVVDALQNGASGYLIKEAVSREFRDAVHAVARGEIYLGRGIPRGVLDHINKRRVDPYDSLTDRERQVLQSFAEGKSFRQIGETLSIAVTAVGADYANLMRKLDIDNQIELVKFAIRRQMIAIE
jgi:DNA-binding NarL/FixJ family response regulator